MKICLVNYESGLGVKDGILTKYAQKMEEGLKALGVDAYIKADPDETADINHHINFLSYKPAQTKNTVMVTHFTEGTTQKLAVLKQVMKTADVGICFDEAQVKRLNKAKFKNIEFVLPAHDSLPRRPLVIAILTKTYADGRKREWMVSELLRAIDKKKFGFRIMGFGWRGTLERLFSEGMMVEYFEDFDLKVYEYILQSADYLLYTGDEDCLAQSVLDAKQAGLKVIAPPTQARGLTVDFPFKNQKELNVIFKSLERNEVEDWTWDRYCKNHLAIWKKLLN